MPINKVDDHFSQSPQIRPEDIPAIVAAGYKGIARRYSRRPCSPVYEAGLYPRREPGRQRSPQILPWNTRSTGNC